MIPVDKYHGVGGSYTLDPKTGVRTQTQKPTARHPDGDAARDEDGKLLNKAHDVLEPAFPAPATAAAAPDDQHKRAGKSAGEHKGE